MAKSAKLKCTCCGKEKAPTRDFYLSHSNLYTNNEGRMTICKDCFFDRYHSYVNKYGDEVKALYHLCMNFDIYFNEKLVEAAYGQSNRGNDKDSLVKTYITKVNSMLQYKGKSSFESEHIVLDVNAISEIENKYLNEINKLKEEKESVVETIEITKEVKKMWGVGYSEDDYIFLENTYKEFTDVYESRTPAQRLIFKNIAKSLLEGDKALRANNPKIFENMNNVVSKLMADGNIKPIQEASVAEDDTATWGKWVNLIEQERPVGEPLDQFKDVDKISSYITKWFTKQMQRVFDLNTGDECDKD